MPDIATYRAYDITSKEHKPYYLRTSVEAIVGLDSALIPGPPGPPGEPGQPGEQGPGGESFVVLGTFDTLNDLEVALPVGAPGDAYGIGVSDPRMIYVWDVNRYQWVEFSTIQGERGPQGMPGEAGPPSTLNPRGVFLPGEVYFKNDLIISPDFENSFYCLQDNVTDPPSHPMIDENWALLILRGAPGRDGKDGRPGADGFTPWINDGKWWIGSVNTGVTAEGVNGINGATFTPSVDSNGVITWTNDAGLFNPTPRTIMGQPGRDGVDGRSFAIAGTFDDLTALETMFPAGDGENAYAVGIDNGVPLPVYVWDINFLRWEWLGPVQGERGLQGDPGVPVEIGKSSTHVQWRYAGGASWYNLVPLTDITGPAGPANALQIGVVTTGVSGTNADAEIVGAAPNQTLNLTIPRGDSVQIIPAPNLGAALSASAGDPNLNNVYVVAL